MNISAAALIEKLQSGEIINLLDVRDELEFHTYNIGGSNIPLGKLPTMLDDLDWDKDEEIIVICKMGLRSKTGKHILQQNGYQNVKNLEGGLTAIQKLNTKY
ncbi:rhodanese-related sulfurtransferase [Mucilaginibacter gracilis]|uniref:Rhodanese-related sulfurtransferase n=1 Tax=Mucilaginibacter gracilis TaxID=423350 RepID=A0A495J4T9_9SPHI|nr:rhodanese-like domain-containing protein [Mucilaginibacter gracilis]RKR83622.1 rhodanese-related sulfurtransferase [Mucilaginibacter gracilis]